MNCYPKHFLFFSFYLFLNKYSLQFKTATFHRKHYLRRRFSFGSFENFVLFIVFISEVWVSNLWIFFFGSTFTGFLCSDLFYFALKILNRNARELFIHRPKSKIIKFVFIVFEECWASRLS